MIRIVANAKKKIEIIVTVYIVENLYYSNYKFNNLPMAMLAVLNNYL